MSNLLDLLTVLGIGSIPAAVIYGLFNKRKTSAEAVDLLTGAAVELVQPLQSEVARLQTDLRENIVQHRKEVAELRNLLMDTQAELTQTKNNCEETMALMRRVVDDSRLELDRLNQLLNDSRGEG